MVESYCVLSYLKRKTVAIECIYSIDIYEHLLLYFSNIQKWKRGI